MSVYPPEKVYTFKTFADVTMDLTGCVVVGCRFSGCTLLLWAYREPISVLLDNEFVDCTLDGDAWGAAEREQCSDSRPILKPPAGGIV